MRRRPHARTGEHKVTNTKDLYETPPECGPAFYGSAAANLILESTPGYIFNYAKRRWDYYVFALMFCDPNKTYCLGKDHIFYRTGVYLNSHKPHAKDTQHPNGDTKMTNTQKNIKLIAVPKGVYAGARFKNMQPSPLSAETADFSEYADRVLLSSIDIHAIDKTSATA